MKLRLLVELVAYRFDLQGDAFTRALNASAVVFSDSPSVRERVRAFHDEVTRPGREGSRIQASLLRLIRSMFEDLGLEHGDFTDEFLLKPFNTRPSSMQKPVPPAQLTEQG